MTDPEPDFWRIEIVTDLDDTHFTEEAVMYFRTHKEAMQAILLGPWQKKRRGRSLGKPGRQAHGVRAAVLVLARGGALSDPDDEMAAFDALPPEARALLREAPLPVPSEVVAVLLRVGNSPERAVKRAVELIGHYGTEAVLRMARETE